MIPAKSRGLPSRATSAGLRQSGWATTPVYWRPDLAPDDEVDGPAVVEEFGSTVPVHPGFRATVDRFGNLLVRRHG